MFRRRRKAHSLIWNFVALETWYCLRGVQQSKAGGTMCVRRAGKERRKGLGVAGARGQSGFECDVPSSTSSPKEEGME
ncbi:hypothetical protein C8J57DRAFT_1337705 [Mycena rebaudengoi]|nr:hypothetical protein C8J57DRAFT_1337705 [Mycena rebaudengoi]